MSDGWTTSSGLIEFEETATEETKKNILEFFKGQGFVVSKQDNGTYYMECDGPFDADEVTKFLKPYVNDIWDFYIDETYHMPGENYVSLDFLKDLIEGDE